MSQADSTNSTPMPAVATRRRFLSQAAGVAAGGTVLALAAIQPADAMAAPASLQDTIKAFPALRPATIALDDARERLREASAAYHEVDIRLEEWGLQHPAPRRRRAFQKWLEWA